MLGPRLGTLTHRACVLTSMWKHFGTDEWLRGEGEWVGRRGVGGADDATTPHLITQ